MGWRARPVINLGKVRHVRLVVGAVEVDAIPAGLHVKTGVEAGLTVSGGPSVEVVVLSEHKIS